MSWRVHKTTSLELYMINDFYCTEGMQWQKSICVVFYISRQERQTDVGALPHERIHVLIKPTGSSLNDDASFSDDAYMRSLAIVSSDGVWMQCISDFAPLA